MAVWSELLRSEELLREQRGAAYSLVRLGFEPGPHSFKNVGEIFCRKEWVVRDASRLLENYVGTRELRWSARVPATSSVESGLNGSKAIERLNRKTLLWDSRTRQAPLPSTEDTLGEHRSRISIEFMGIPWKQWTFSFCFAIVRSEWRE